MTQHELENSVIALRKSVNELKYKKKDWWDKFSVVSALLFPLALAAFGYFLSQPAKNKELENNEKAVKATQSELIQKFIDHLSDTSNPIKRQIAVAAISHALGSTPITSEILKIIAVEDNNPSVIAQAKLSLSFPSVQEREVLDEWVIQVSAIGDNKEADKELSEFNKIYEQTHDEVWKNDILLVRNIDAPNSWLIVIDAFHGSSDSLTVNAELQRLKLLGNSTRELQNTFGRWINNGKVIFYGKNKFANLYGRVE